MKTLNFGQLNFKETKYNIEYSVCNFPKLKCYLNLIVKM